MSKNLDFWNSVEKTNPFHTKSVKKSGMTITAINAQQQIKNATSKWGMYGDKWGLKNVDLTFIKELDNSQVLAVSRAVFYYPEGEFEIGSSIFVQSWVSSKGYSRIDDDFMKKLDTDMTTKALSKLGFNADIFMGRYDDNKYVQSLKDEFEPIKQKPEVKIGTEAFKKAKSLVDSGKATVEKLREKYIISEIVAKQLNKK